MKSAGKARATGRKKRRGDASGTFGRTVEQRERGVCMVLGGMTQARAARELGVSRQAVHGWMKAFREGGLRALKTGRRGRPKEQVLLPWQESQVAVAITLVPPAHLGLPHRCWTREAIRRFVELRFGVLISEWMVRSYLLRWGLSSQKRVRGLFRGTPSRLLEWLDESHFGVPPSGSSARADRSTCC